VSQQLCYRVPAPGLRLTMAGIRAPHAPFTQARRSRPEYIAFLVSKGAIHLRDELPDGSDDWAVRAGEIHVIGPGDHQASIIPFAPGIVFHWLHFTVSAPVDRLDAHGMHAELRRLTGTGERERPGRWLVPRHLPLGEELAHALCVHENLMEQLRAGGVGDPGADAAANYFVSLLHRRYLRQELGDTLAASDARYAHASRARILIRTRYDEALSLAGIAVELGIDPSYLARCFRRVTGMSVTDCIQATRIEAARSLLRDGFSIEQTARQVGFSSSSYFCRIFRRVEGRTAGAYLRELGRPSR